MSGAELGNGRDGEVLEGFLCPFCFLDLTSITQLQAHFEEQHESEDKAVLQSLKGFLNKAKKKLLNEDEPDFVPARNHNPFDDGAVEYEPNNPWNWDPPPLGPSRSHTALFKKIRSARIDSFVAETNKLLIRLDKLLKDLPSDPVKRKAHERSIVMWADDKDVPLCPFCARSFNLARRRHHCRLCGGIMCNECSHFLEFEYAKKLISPVHQGSMVQSAAVNVSSGVGSSMSSLFSGISGLRRSGSQGSLNSLLSVMDSMTTEQNFRICTHCMTRLQARDNQVEQRTSKPTLSMYYEKLMEYRSQIESLLPQFIRMAESLSLRDAEELRVKILKKGDSLNSMAQRVRNLGSSTGQDIGDAASSHVPPSGPRQELLQRRIQSTTTAFLKEQILSLPKLPTHQELKEMQERRSMDSRRMFTAMFKLRVIEYAEQTHNCAAAREFKVSKKSVRDWKKLSAQLKLLPKNKCANRGKCNKWPQLEVEVAKYVSENRQNGYGVSRGSIRIFALNLARKLGITDFKASHGWCTRFMKRNDFVLRRKTKISQRLPQELDDKVIEFHRMEAEARLAAEKEATRRAEARAAEILRRRDRDSRDSPRSTPSRSSSVTPPSFSSLKKRQQTEEVVVDTGWGADSSAHNVTETDDPMIQQMNIIRNYIKQAREASRYDDVPLLEANLRELQEEYKKQQRLMNP
ncbi:Rabenosyn-5-like [Homarus americanus]|uniref:Rabenosyn-5-like n=1 Tax=Homarus americanus TaxID=6706 RepID=A0A8J5N890_HOMAM|nr:Rabenosyn-5-like [Homarus americanus]